MLAYWRYNNYDFLGLGIPFDVCQMEPGLFFDSREYFEDILLNFDKQESVENWFPWNWKKFRFQTYSQAT